MCMSCTIHHSYLSHYKFLCRCLVQHFKHIFDDSATMVCCSHFLQTPYVGRTWGYNINSLILLTLCWKADNSWTYRRTASSVPFCQHSPNFVDLSIHLSRFPKCIQSLNVLLVLIWIVRWDTICQRFINLLIQPIHIFVHHVNTPRNISSRSLRNIPTMLLRCSTIVCLCAFSK